MPDNEENYRQLDKLISPSVSRVLAEEDLQAGETEEAIATLLDEAFTAGRLTDKAIELAETRYDGGPVDEMLEAIKTIRAKNSAA